MFQIVFNPYMESEIKHRQEELIKEAELIRLIKELRTTGAPKVSAASKILAQLGKGLVNLGSNLEERFGAQGNSPLNQQTESGGCA